jgi:Domain of unknown function (DUF4190)
MKRCPTCNQTFSETWLSFCTQDGTTLVDEAVRTSDPLDPMATMMAPAPPPLTNPNQPANWTSPSGGLGSGQFQPPQPLQSGWQPPPPPAYFAGPKQGTAVASLICGIFTVTIGWCCYLGVITGPVAIGLAIYSLIQIKNSPDKFTGKPFAITGIVTSAVYFLGLALFILIYGVAIFMQGIK